MTIIRKSFTAYTLKIRLHNKVIDIKVFQQLCLRYASCFWIKNVDKKNYYRDTIVFLDNNEKENNNGSIGNNMTDERVLYIRTFINFVYPNVQLYVKTLLADIKNHSSLFFTTICISDYNVRTIVRVLALVLRTFPYRKAWRRLLTSTLKLAPRFYVLSCKQAYVRDFRV